MGQSQRHHYIPQFLIKNFSNDKSKLYVYYKEKEEIKETVPKSIFFDWNRNTLPFVDGRMNDKMESIYSFLDTLMAVPINQVISELKTDSQSLRYIILLAALMKWRVPNSDEMFNKIKDKISFEEFGLKLSPICNQEEADPQIISESMNLESFNEMKRILMPALLFADQAYYEEVQKGCFLVCNGGPNLLGDCGYIEDRTTDHRQLGNMLMSISSDCTFVYKPGKRQIKEEDKQIFCSIKNLIVFRTSQKYVACGSKEELTKYINLAKQTEKYSTEDLMKQVFGLII